MPIKTRIVDGDGSGLEAHVHPFNTAARADHAGILALTRRFINTEPQTKFFTNETQGVDMNKDVSFGTTGNILHDGGSTATVDTGSATTDIEFSLVDTGATWGSGGDAGQVQIGMTVEETGASAYARIKSVAGTALELTTIPSKGDTNSDIFPLGSEAYIINAVWVGTATVGTWDFSTNNEITQAAGNNNDQADIEANSLDQSLASDFTALTGSLNLNTYSETTHNVQLQMTLAGVPVGNAILLNDFINPGDFDAQKFVIPIDDLVVSDQLMNGIRITVVRSGGAKPAFTLDDLRLEVSGTPLVYSVNVDNGDKFHISEIVFGYADTSATTIENPSMSTISFDKIGTLASLATGFVITRTQAGITLFSATVRTIGEHLSSGARIEDIMDDGTNTFFTLRAVFPDPLILTGDPDDTLSVTINDNMSGLLQFTAAARGSIEEG